MSDATEFISFTLGDVTVSAFVTPEDLARIESGGVVDVLLRQVVAVHGDVGEDVPLGDGHVQFIRPPAKVGAGGAEGQRQKAKSAGC